MNLRLIIVMCFYFFCQDSSGQNFTIFGISAQDFEGKIKTVEDSKYKVKVINDSIIIEELKDFILFPPYKKYSFDTLGNLVEVLEYNKSKEDSIRIENRWSYFYNGVLLDSIIRTNDKYNSKPWKFYYTWQSMDSIFYDSYINSSKRRHLIVKEPNKETMKYYKNDGIIHTEEVSTFDDKNRKIRFEVYRSNRLSTLSITNYVKNDSIESSKNYETNLKKNSVKRGSAEYNKYGDPIRIEKSSHNEERLYISTFKYEYDHYNNWIKKERFTKDGILVEIERRKLEYY